MAPARILFIVTQSFTLLIGAIGVATAYISLFTDLNAFTDFVPFEIFQSTGIISAAVVFVSFLGLVMVICKAHSFFWAFILLTFAQIVFNIGFIVVVIFFQNGRKTFGYLDNVLEDTITNFDANALDIALADSDNFIVVQNLLNCCGINMEVRIDINGNAEEVEAVHSGDRCLDEIELNGVLTNGNEQMNELIANFSGAGNAVVLAEAEGNEIVGEEDFFCEEDLNELTNNSLRLINFILGVIVFFELISFLSACLIFCFVKRDEDGKLDFDNPEGMNQVIVKVTKNVKQPFKEGFAKFNNGPSFKGSMSFLKKGSMTGKSMSGNLVNREPSEDGEVSGRVIFGKKGAGLTSGLMNMIAPFMTSSNKVKRVKELDELSEEDKNSEADTIPDF